MLSGARSDAVENVLFIRGRRECVRCGGEEEMIPVDEVGTGVGYCLALRYLGGELLVGECSLEDSRATRFTARGSWGEDE